MTNKTKKEIRYCTYCGKEMKREFKPAETCMMWYGDTPTIPYAPRYNRKTGERQYCPYYKCPDYKKKKWYEIGGSPHDEYFLEEIWVDRGEHNDTAKDKRDLEPTPEWIINAKYRSVLQIVQDTHEWDEKYPLLETIIEGIENQARKDEGGKIRRELQELTWHQNNKAIKELKDDTYYIALADLQSIIPLKD